MLDICNYYERLVIDQLWKITLDPKEIKDHISQSFIDDVACLALNKLPSCYVCSSVDKGSYLTESKYEEMQLQVKNAIAEAIAQVLHSPHDARDE